VLHAAEVDTTVRNCPQLQLAEVGQTSTSNGIRELREVAATAASWLEQPGGQGWQDRREVAFSMSSGSPVPRDTKTARLMVFTTEGDRPFRRDSR